MIAVTQVKADTAVEDSQAMKAIVDTAPEPPKRRPPLRCLPHSRYVLHSQITPYEGNSEKDEEKTKKKP